MFLKRHVHAQIVYKILYYQTHSRGVLLQFRLDISFVQVFVPLDVREVVDFEGVPRVEWVIVHACKSMFCLFIGSEFNEHVTFGNWDSVGSPSWFGGYIPLVFAGTGIPRHKDVVLLDRYALFWELFYDFCAQPLQFWFVDDGQTIYDEHIVKPFVELDLISARIISNVACSNNIPQIHTLPQCQNSRYCRLPCCDWEIIERDDGDSGTCFFSGKGCKVTGAWLLFVHVFFTKTVVKVCRSAPFFGFILIPLSLFQSPGLFCLCIWLSRIKF